MSPMNSRASDLTVDVFKRSLDGVLNLWKLKAIYSNTNSTIMPNVTINAGSVDGVVLDFMSRWGYTVSSIHGTDDYQCSVTWHHGDFIND